jgi:hypothetical protein
VDPKRECLYDVDWQLLRVELLSKWHTDPEGNVRQLLKYMAEGRTQTDYEQFIRTWRCLNLLRAVPLGDNKQVRRVLLKARRGFEIKYNKYIGYGRRFRTWDWTKVRDELQVLYDHWPEQWLDLKRNLEARVRKVGQSSTVGYMQQKPEAAKFIRLMRDIEFDGQTVRSRQEEAATQA